MKSAKSTYSKMLSIRFPKSREFTEPCAALAADSIALDIFELPSFCLGINLYSMKFWEIVKAVGNSS